MAKLGAASGGDCLAEFSQLVADSWVLAGAGGAPASGVTSLEDCLASCSGTCMWATYNYNTDVCTKYTATNTGNTLVALRAAPSGDDVQAEGAKAEAIASGFFTYWRHSGAVGTALAGSPGADTTFQACSRACSGNPSCAAFSMASPTGTALDSTGTCTLLAGDTTVDTGMRSLMRAVPAQLAIPALV